MPMLARPCVAIVGARNASAAACRFARQIAADLAGQGITIVSGLARGVDTAAHVGALGGATAAVIASGIDIAFPTENAALQDKIAADQLLIAEQPPGTEPLARHFPARNRIIAGLAVGTVVIEAAPRSGSLITARRAGDYGREVMAVPGSPLDPRAQGCNLLIREGATLIQTAADVLEAVGPIDRRMVREPARVPTPHPADVEAADGDRDGIAGVLGPTPVPVDELVRQSGRPSSVVQLVLLELELAGRVERHAGGKISAR
jgi:DNA processing protein